LNVLSLFDGISCGMVALERAGIKVDNYFASEIDKWAIEISTKNYPAIERLGDITKIGNVRLKQLPKIDIVIGGSPCQDISNLNKEQLGLKGKKSGHILEF
jgi:DNA (cytosine-5)-methyltransferase 3A